MVQKISCAHIWKHPHHNHHTHRTDLCDLHPPAQRPTPTCVISIHQRRAQKLCCKETLQRVIRPLSGDFVRRLLYRVSSARSRWVEQRMEFALPSCCSVLSPCAHLIHCATLMTVQLIRTKSWSSARRLNRVLAVRVRGSHEADCRASLNFADIVYTSCLLGCAAASLCAGEPTGARSVCLSVFLSVSPLHSPITDAEEALVQQRHEAVGNLTGDCDDLYKQVSLFVVRLLCCSAVQTPFSDPCFCSLRCVCTQHISFRLQLCTLALDAIEGILRALPGIAHTLQACAKGLP